MKKIILIILLLIVSKVSEAQFEKQTTASSLGLDTADIFQLDQNETVTGNTTFEGNITFYDTIFSDTETPVLGDWRLVNRNDGVYYFTYPSIEKDTGQLKLNIRNNSRDLSAGAFVTFNTFATGFNDPTENSYIGQGGKAFYVMNMSNNGLFLGGGSHDKYLAVLDTSASTYWSAVNSVSVGGSITSFRNPLGSATNRRFMATSNDSVAGQSRNWNIINPFSNYVGLKLTGTQGITSTHWINEADSSRNFDGTNTRGINWRRDGKLLFRVDGDTNATEWFDFLSANPVVSIRKVVDSLNSTDIVEYIQNKPQTSIAQQLQNNTSGFDANSGFRHRIDGLNATSFNLENGTYTLTTNGNSNQLRLNANGSVTFSGAIEIGNTVNSVSPTNPDRTITVVIGGTTYYIPAKTTND